MISIRKAAKAKVVGKLQSDFKSVIVVIGNVLVVVLYHVFCPSLFVVVRINIILLQEIHDFEIGNRPALSK